MNLPSTVVNTLQMYRVCEFSTVARDGTPITWPLAAQYQPELNRFLITTSIGFPQKAFDIQREAKVSMLYSDHTGSGLKAKPHILVQGEANVSDEIITSPAGYESYWQDVIFARQPASKMLSGNPLMRWFMDWYYMRLIIDVTPHKIYWWANGDTNQTPKRLEMSYVE